MDEGSIWTRTRREEIPDTEVDSNLGDGCVEEYFEVVPNGGLREGT